MIAIIVKGDRKKKLFKGMALKIIRFEWDIVSNGRIEPHVVLEKDKAEVLYPMMYIEIGSERIEDETKA